MTQTNPTPPAGEKLPHPSGMTQSEVQRYQTFVWIQMFFLGVSLFAGGFNFTVWSMLDTSILVVSIGMAGLLFVIDEALLRRKVFYTTVILYLLAVLDMAINILVSGSVGWGRF